MNLMEALIQSKLGGGGGGGSVTPASVLAAMEGMDSEQQSDARAAIGATDALTSIPDDVKQSLLNCFAHVAWADDEGLQYFSDLQSALYDGVLESISAVFDPGQDVIYDTAMLDDLRQYLTVTAHYSVAGDVVVNGYTLSGSLTVGTSVITVTYGSQSTTVSVTVVAYPPLWETEDQAFDGGNVVTNVTLCDEDRDWTIAYDVSLETNPSTSGSNASTYRLFRIQNNAGTRYTLAFYKQAYNSTKFTFGYMQDGSAERAVSIGTVGTGRYRIVATHSKNSGIASVSVRKDNGTVESVSVTAAFEASSAGLAFGQSSGVNQLPKGTLNNVSVWDIVWDNDRINDFLGV